MGRFPPGFIDELKAQADIVQVIQDVVPLKQAGSTYKGLCPFHREKTPSFNVNRDKGFFHCFGCSTGGDVLKFVELYEKLSFPEAVASLAQRFGLPIPESDDPQRDRAAVAEREALLKVHELADELFRSHLRLETGTHARAYLERREIRPETIDALGLGCTPPRRDGLTRHLLDAGQPLELLLKSGLVVQRDGAAPIDRFRHRLMIPIARDTGSVIGFGGRALAPDQQPKYVNSPETALYTKGRTLYGLHLAKAAVRRLGYAVLVEGYFDLAQAVQAGVEPVVATCGTALTEPQARLLRRFCGRTLLSFDPDSAGQGASARSGELLLEEGFEVNVVQLPAGEDPDAFIRTQGAAQYVERLKSSQRYLDYVVDRAAARHDLSREGQRTRFVNDMLSVAARIPDPVARDQFADRIAHRSGTTEEVVRRAIRQAATGRRPEVRSEIRAAQAAPRPAETGLIWATMRDTEAAQSVLLDMEPEDFDGLPTETILRVARTLAGVPSAGVPETLMERLGEQEADLVRGIAAAAVAPAGVQDCATELRRRRYERQRAALQEEIDRRQRDGSPAALGEIDTLWARKKELLQRIDALTR